MAKVLVNKAWYIRSAATPLLIGVCLIPSSAQSSGFSFEPQTARTIALAMSNAGVSRDDVGNRIYNPASFADDGLNLSFISAFVDVDVSNAAAVRSTLTPASGSPVTNNLVDDAFLGSFSGQWTLNDRLIIGLSLSAPYGLSQDYGQNSVARYSAVESKILTIETSPNITARLSENWSVGAAINVNYADVRLTSAVDAAAIEFALTNGAASALEDDVTASINADDISVGYTLGVAGQPTLSTRVGLFYKSQVTHDLDGSIMYDVETSMAGQRLAAIGLFRDGRVNAVLPTPARFGVSASVDINDKTALYGSFYYQFWSAVDRINIYESSNPDAPIVQNFQWSDTASYAIGAEHAVSPGLSLQTGIFIEASPTNGIVDNPSVADSDRLWLTAGLAWKSKRFTTQASAGYVLFDDRRLINNDEFSLSPLRGDLAQELSGGAAILSIGITYNY